MSEPEHLRETCPQCGSTTVAAIAYGLPGPELWEAAGRGEVALGGCVVTGCDPKHACRDCGHEW